MPDETRPGNSSKNVLALGFSAHRDVLHAIHENAQGKHWQRLPATAEFAVPLRADLTAAAVNVGLQLEDPLDGR